MIGEYERAGYASQYASMAPLFEHYGVSLWMPEVGGRVDWHAEDHEQTMLALGHAARMRWNPADRRITSERDVNPVIIEHEQFEQAQTILAGRGSRTPHKPHRRPRAYALRGVLLCGLCDRRMTGNWNNHQAYYRCRFPAEHALANRVDHPKTVYLREAEVLHLVEGVFSTASQRLPPSWATTLTST